MGFNCILFKQDEADVVHMQVSPRKTSSFHTDREDKMLRKLGGTERQLTSYILETWPRLARMLGESFSLPESRSHLREITIMAMSINSTFEGLIHPSLECRYIFLL